MVFHKFYLVQRSGIVYKFQRGDCIATYYGKTKVDFKLRMCA